MDPSTPGAPLPRRAGHSLRTGNRTSLRRQPPRPSRTRHTPHRKSPSPEVSGHRPHPSGPPGRYKENSMDRLPPTPPTPPTRNCRLVSLYHQSPGPPEANPGPVPGPRYPWGAGGCPGTRGTGPASIRSCLLSKRSPLTLNPIPIPIPIQVREPLSVTGPSEAVDTRGPDWTTSRTTSRTGHEVAGPNGSTSPKVLRGKILVVLDPVDPV